MSDERGNVMISPLVADIMTAIITDAGNTSRRLIDSLMAQLKEANAWRQAVEHGVSDLLAGPYAPSASAIERAVFLPSKHLIEHYMRGEVS